MGLLTDVVTVEVGIEVGAVDVDFAADLGEGDDALVAVVLPSLCRDPSCFGAVSDFCHIKGVVHLIHLHKQYEQLAQ